MGRGAKERREAAVQPDIPRSLDELIEALQELREEHGNLPVLNYQDGSPYPIERPRYVPRDQEYELDDYGLKAAIIF